MRVPIKMSNEAKGHPDDMFYPFVNITQLLRIECMSQGFHPAHHLPMPPFLPCATGPKGCRSPRDRTKVWKIPTRSGIILRVTSRFRGELLEWQEHITKVCGGNCRETHVTTFYWWALIPFTKCEQVHPAPHCRNVVIILTGQNKDYSGTSSNNYNSVHCNPTKLGLRKFQRRKELKEVGEKNERRVY